MVALTVTKKRILAVLCFILAAVLAVCACIQGARAIQAASTKRSLPIYNVQTDEKKIAISFDAAWGNEQTQTLIDILKQYNVHATFFVVGAWVDKYPDSVKALAEAGHEVCNHSNTHPHMPKLTQQEMTAQITECNKKIMAITGKSPLLFRPPYGDYNNAVIDTVNSLKMYPIQWDVDSLDWKDPTPQQISSRVISKVKPGSIILMHNGAKNTPQALPTILQTLQSQGYQFVRISELIYKDNYTIDNAGKQIPNQSAPHKTSSASSMAVSTSTK
ncbi:MAG: Polysaccharide deacetylase [Thermocaproicibacter melissae]|jgi:peptidoglycan-N-acetylglucosamine deacetylase|uniref:polysaccharide deacetylase family protein n=1 Tax=Thermocaproicibacter melissae TaxID=2966552 RepID=UPI003A0FE613